MRRIHLYLYTPKLIDAADFAPKLALALGSTKVACVLVRAGEGGDIKKIVKELAPVIQGAGAALMVDNDAQLVARVGADGVQINGAGDALRGAVETLRPKSIVGACNLKTKDECMTAGELDIDFLMFGEPSKDGFVQNISKTVERVNWWAEIFNVPCIGYAPREEDIAPLTAAGADFIALGDWLWTHEDVAAKLKEIAQTIRDSTPAE